MVATSQTQFGTCWKKPKSTTLIAWSLQQYQAITCQSGRRVIVSNFKVKQWSLSILARDSDSIPVTAILLLTNWPNTLKTSRKPKSYRKSLKSLSKEWSISTICAATKYQLLILCLLAYTFLRNLKFCKLQATQLVTVTLWRSTYSDWNWAWSLYRQSFDLETNTSLSNQNDYWDALSST